MITTFLLDCGSSTSSPDITNTLKNHNLIIINIDSLRADHMGCYNYKRNTTPYIDSLGKNGILFEKTLSNSSFTLESVSTLLSGKLPSSGHSTGYGAFPPHGIKLMGELFKEAGYKTAFLSNTNVLHHSNFSRGFQEVYLRTTWGVSGKGPQLSACAGRFIQTNKKNKFMIYLHYLDPHGPYQPPDNYYLKFASKKYPHPIPLYAFVRGNCQRLMEKGFGPGEARFEDMVLRYDAEIAYIDKSIQLLFQHLEQHQLMKNTLVIITADHGEEFLEHGFVEHAWTVYRESLHVPLIFWAPGKLKEKRIPSLVSTVDILPTLLDVMEIPNKRRDFDGTSLFKPVSGGFRFYAPKKPYIGELMIQHRNLIRTVIKDNWKYIAAVRYLEPSERPAVLHNVGDFEANTALHRDIWGPVVHEELYDLSQSPDEQRQADNNQKRRQLKTILHHYKKHCLRQGVPKPPRNQKKRKLSPEETKRLKSLGYL